MPIGCCQAISGYSESRPDVLSRYFKSLYRDAMHRAYERQASAVPRHRMERALRRARSRARGLDIAQGDLNQGIPCDDRSFRFLKACHRVLRPGRLVLLTPNISTYFTAVLVLLGRMPSSGPHPDSNELLERAEIFRVSGADRQPDTETIRRCIAT